MEEVNQGGSGKKWFFGCCGGLILFMFLLGGAGYFGAGYVKDKGVSLMTEGIAKSLEHGDLPEDQAASINAQMQRLDGAVKSWGVIETLKHFGNLESVATEVGTIGFHVILLSYGHFVLPNTDMPEEEREAGRRTLQRCARAVDEGKLVINEKDDAWQLNAKSNHEDEVEFDVEEVRAHLAQLKARVDTAGIPDEAYQVDLSDRVTTIVDAILAE